MDRCCSIELARHHAERFHVLTPTVGGGFGLNGLSCLLHYGSVDELLVELLLHQGGVVEVLNAALMLHEVHCVVEETPGRIGISRHDEPFAERYSLHILAARLVGLKPFHRRLVLAC